MDVETTVSHQLGKEVLIIDPGSSPLSHQIKKRRRKNTHPLAQLRNPQPPLAQLRADSTSAPLSITISGKNTQANFGHVHFSSFPLISFSHLL
jgi:hypothetical protein